MKRRIDLLLVERGFAESRHKAQALLLAGQILALPYNYETRQWVTEPRKMLDVPLARSTSN